MSFKNWFNLLETAYNRLRCYASRPSIGGYDPMISPESYWRQSSRDSARWPLLDDSFELDDYQFRRQRSWDSVRGAQTKFNLRPRILPARLAESDEPLCKPDSGASSNGECSDAKNRTEPEMKDIFERLVRLEQNDREKQIKIEKLEGDLSSAVKLFSTATHLIRDITARHCHGVFVWKIPNFKELCTGMRKDPNFVKHSPGFYTDTFGYKMCLRFNLTTPSSEGVTAIQPVDVPLEKDSLTHISLYVHLMKGEFDDTLRWPFHGEMTLHIIHPKNSDHSFHESIYSKPGFSAYIKPTLPRNPTGIGFREFIAINKAFQEGYVNNDTLICKIHAKANSLEPKFNY